MTAKGTFRTDLFHRLGVLAVHMPALRERPEDIDPLLDHFARSQRAELGTSVEFTASARTAARRAAWTGNVRELRNAVHRAALLAQGQPIDAEALLPADGPSRTSSSSVQVPLGRYEHMRRATVREVVARVGSQRRAAALLGIPRSTLGNWLRED
jgi:DNA-binding NtrC family response regulator